MKLKSAKQQQAQLIPGRRHTPASQIAQKICGKQDLQNVGQRKTPTKTQVTSNYTIVRSVGRAQMKESNHDLLNAVAFQKHHNMPLQMKSEAISTQQKSFIAQPRDASHSSSRERVEWDPLIKNRGASLRQKQTGKQAQNSLKKREDLGLDFMRIKKELAMELPFAFPKKVKQVTPSTVQLKDKSSVDTTTNQRKKIEQITLPQKQPQTLKQKNIDSERQILSNAKWLKVDEQQRKQTLYPPKNNSHRQLISKERQKKLVEHQKREWQQKENEEKISQLSEQYRILKNLKKVNSIARSQAFKAAKKQRILASQKALKSARSKRGRALEQQTPAIVNYVVTELDSTSSYDKSQNSDRMRYSSVKQNIKRENVFNVQISSVTESISAPSSQGNSQQRQAYSSPVFRQSKTGTTGTAESDKIEARKSSRLQTRQNTDKMKQERQKLDKQKNKLNPLMLYQPLSDQDKAIQKSKLPQSSQSHRQSMGSDSSNLNYSPATTIEKRSASHSTYRVMSRSESSNRASQPRIRPHSSVHKKPVKSSSSKKSQKKARPLENEIEVNRRAHKNLKSGKKNMARFESNADESKSLAGKLRNLVDPTFAPLVDLTLLSCFRERLDWQDCRREQKEKTKEATTSMALRTSSKLQQAQHADQKNQEDLVIFLILTQAACKIQNAFRAYSFRKKRFAQKEPIESETLSEFEEVGSKRGELRSFEKPVISALKSLVSSIQSPLESSRQEVAQEENRNLIQKRKQTFSFGNDLQNANNDVHDFPSSMLQQLMPSHKKPQQVLTYQNAKSSRTAEPERLNGGRDDGKAEVEKKQKSSRIKAYNQINSDKQKVTFEIKKRNVQLNLRRVSAQDSNLHSQKDQVAKGTAGNYYGPKELKMEAGSDSRDSRGGDDERLEEESSGSLYYERVISAKLNLNQGYDQENLAKQTLDCSQTNVNDLQFAKENWFNKRSHAESSLSACSDDIQSHIVAEAGEDISLQNILKQQKRMIYDSLSDSVAERTDKIINYSGALNTSEDLIQGNNIIHAALDSMLNTGDNANLGSLINPYLIGMPVGGSQEALRKVLLGSQEHSVNNSMSRKMTISPGKENKNNFIDTDQSRKSMMRMVSGDERFLIKHSSKDEPYFQHSNTKTETYREALQIISELQIRDNQAANQSMDDQQIKTDDNFFQSVLYPKNMSQSSYLQQNLSLVSIDQTDQSKDSISILKQGYGATQSFFLNTNASIFERNPFQDFTASKLNSLLSGKTIKGGPNAIEQLIQVKEDALKFISKLEKGWISRQEKLSMITYRHSNRKRYELEQWVTAQRLLPKPISHNKLQSDYDFDPSASQVRHFCKQVEEIVQKVNRKADEIREQLYQRSQDRSVRQQQIEGYSDMHLYKKAVGISSKVGGSGGLTGEIKQLNNIEVIDQSQEGILVEEQTEDALDISNEEIEEEITAEKTNIELPQKHQSRINADILPSSPSELTQTPSYSADENQSELLSEEITDRILAQILSEELFEDHLLMIFNRKLERTSIKISKTSPGGSRIRGEPILEVAVTSDKDFNINTSITVDQIIAGVDTSIDAVDQYVEGIFSQIRIRAKQFMNAFYTPIYRNPLAILTKIQKQGIGQAAQNTYDSNAEARQSHQDFGNTLSSILNVQLYLTLEKARENVIRDALKQIKEQAKDGEDLAIDSNLSELLSESDHIHNKAIFDAVNEALNMVRPYGKLGEPMPWSSRPRKNFFPFANENDLNGVLKNVKNCILDWAQIKAGQISQNVVTQREKSPRKSNDEELNPNGEISGIKQAQFKQMSEETLVLQREKSLAKLLTSEIKHQEERWLDYETEETQVKIDVSDHILEQLIEEIANELNTISTNRQ